MSKAGFEPARHIAKDLQSLPFGPLGTCSFFIMTSYMTPDFKINTTMFMPKDSPSQEHKQLEKYKLCVLRRSPSFGKKKTSRF